MSSDASDDAGPNEDGGAGKPVSRAQKAVGWFEDASKDRGNLARLRRCATPDEAACEEAVFDLALRLRDGKGPVTEDGLRRAGLLAGVLAEVREDAKGQSLGSMLGKPRSAGGPPRFSRLRFRALMESREPQEAMAVFRRAVAILDGTAPVLSLSERLLDWTDTRPSPLDPSGRRTRADEARVRLTREYHEAVQA